MSHILPPFDAAANVRDRFLRYVQIDTQSREDAATYPSTAKQLDLSRLLVEELSAIGLADASMDEFGYVMATAPSTLPAGVPEPPTIGFLAHVDTSSELSGANVRPQVVRFGGQPIMLPGDVAQHIALDNDPDLATCLGHDLVTSDGTTLLGADDKAGVAEIVSAAAWLTAHPEIPHGALRFGFTLDEEVGRGTERFDIAKFGARYAYTMDGGAAGEVETETFSADLAVLTITGVSAHPGYAKGVLVNSIKLAARLLSLLPPDRLSPETTDEREGYVHPYVIEGGSEQTVLRILLRDFDAAGLRQKEALIRDAMAIVAADEPRASLSLQVRQQYRNMGETLDRHPHVVAFADEAVRRAGLTPHRTLARGGTDGARLTAMGLPTPNIFAGGHNHHSKREWVSVQDMAKAVETIVHLAVIWGEGVKE